MNISLLGSTGSIGTQCLSVVDMFPDRYSVFALAAGSNARVFQQQLDKYRPQFAAMSDAAAAKSIQVPRGCTFLTGADGVRELAALKQADTVVVAIVGIAGLDAAYQAACAGKRVALANKEALVTGGKLINDAAQKSGAVILPVDSEHSAIFQCLQGQYEKSVSRLILTASGGAFRDYTEQMLENATPEEALCHPNWSMGEKITVDCATMMNKGLEVIEAHWLFGLPADRIDVVVHRQSVIHSMVEFCDGAVMAQLGCPDMRLPIAYALSYPERLNLPIGHLDFGQAFGMTFEPPDKKRFPCLELAYEALRRGGAMPAVLNAANEEAVKAFLSKKIGFNDIARMVEYALKTENAAAPSDIEEIHTVDKCVREKIRRNFKLL